MIQRIDVPAPMRDGVKLSADIRTPDSAGSFPVILVRTPYGNGGFSDALRAYVESGYAVVVQDCRGRFDSEGRFDPLREDLDGHDTIAWLRQQPWCDGRIGMYGGSYGGLTQYAAAWTQPEGLAAITPSVMGHDLFKNLLFENGALNLSIAMAWGARVSGRTQQVTPTTDWEQVYKHLPLITMPEAAGFRMDYYKEWLAHPTYDDYWAKASVEQRHDQINVPVFHLGGWYDVYYAGAFRNYCGLRSQGGPLARKHQKILIGPWAHGLNTRTIGQVDFGVGAVVELESMKKRWLDRWVKGERNGIDEEPPVRIFVMGENVWRDEKEWPLARAEETAVFLASQRSANSLYGDGLLSFTPVEGGESDEYLYNPANPVPTVGGAYLGDLAGPTDHRPIERRDDVLVYTSDALEKPLETTGFIKLVLFASSDAVDTDFIARLCDVHPDGRSINLCDGILRTRFREGLDKEVMMTPGTVHDLEMDLCVTSNVFLPGHRIRLEITSSCFPRFSRNLNTGEPTATGTRMQCARQTVRHSQAHPSRLILPVVRRDDL